MEPKQQTQINENNRQKFYQTSYPQQCMSKDQLIQLNDINASCYVLIDCCGWYYKELWPELNIVSLETLSSALNFKIAANKLQGIIDTRNFDKIVWPKLQVDNPALIFDNAPMLNYRPIKDIADIVSSAAKKYNASSIVVNIQMAFLDGPVLVDRFQQCCLFVIPDYIVTKFEYDTKILKIHARKKLNYDQC